MRDDLTATKEELSQCKDDVFRLQTASQVPDSEISKRFESLGQQIIHWIDAKVADFDTARPEAEPDRVFLVGEDKQARTFLRLHPGAGEHLARYLIHRFLDKNVFGKKLYFFGLSDEKLQFMKDTELEMARFDPPRGM